MWCLFEGQLLRLRPCVVVRDLVPVHPTWRCADCVGLRVLCVLGRYFMPYWIGVIWLDVVTYLHHHGSSDAEEKMPWYRCVA